MRFTSGKAFAQQDHINLTLVAMSGVGKTTLAHKLPRKDWFHFSGDFRIGTRYLGEAISDNIKAYAMQDPFLAKLLRSDSIYIGSNIGFSNLEPLSTFLGQLGDPAKGGLPLEEFRRRQRMHRLAEINAMLDVGQFQFKAQNLYGYPHFLNDAGGSLVEVIDLDDPHDPVLRHLVERSVLIYIKASDQDMDTLCARAERHPKPMYFNDEFLDWAVARFASHVEQSDPDKFDPDAFSRWVFPHMIAHRQPLYEKVGREHAYTISSQQAAAVRDEKDLMDLISQTIDLQENASCR